MMLKCGQKDNTKYTPVKIENFLDELDATSQARFQILVDKIPNFLFQAAPGGAQAIYNHAGTATDFTCNRWHYFQKRHTYRYFEQIEDQNSMLGTATYSRTHLNGLISNAVAVLSNVNANYLKGGGYKSLDVGNVQIGVDNTIAVGQHFITHLMPINADTDINVVRKEANGIFKFK